MKMEPYHVAFVQAVEARVKGWPNLKALATIGMAKGISPESVPADIPAAAARFVRLMEGMEIRPATRKVPVYWMSEVGSLEMASQSGPANEQGRRWETGVDGQAQSGQ